MTACRAPADEVRAAGAAVIRAREDAVLELLVVHRPRYDDWSLPKGKLKAGEPAPVAAVREIAEETGYHARLGAPLGTVRYQKGGRPKEVQYWRASVVDCTPFVSNDETDAIEWLDLPGALGRLTTESDRAIARGAAGQGPTSALIVARHTASVARPAWPAADPDRPLDERGRRQAVQLKRLLTAWSPERVASSPSRRCVETITPYAAGRTVDLVPALSEESHAREPAALIAFLEGLVGRLTAELTPRTDPAASNHLVAPGSVLCTHRPVLCTIADALGVPLAPGSREEPLPPGGVWVVHLAAESARTVEQHAV